jgi:hypothetical protein
VLTNSLYKCLQIVALEILLNIFSDYDEVNAPKAMEAVPALCNLLQNSDTMVSMIIYDEKCVCVTKYIHVLLILVDARFLNLLFRAWYRLLMVLVKMINT